MFVFQRHRIPFTEYHKLNEFVLDSPFLKDIVDFLDIWFDHTQAQVEVATSGSTGTPKVIGLSKAAMTKSALKSAAFFSFEKEHRTLLRLPVRFIAGKMMLVRAIVSEMDIVLEAPSATELLENMNDNEIFHFIPMTPFQFSTGYAKHPNKFKRIKTILLGGGPITTDVSAILPKVDTVVYHGFGMTETITHVAVKKLNHGKQDSYQTLSGVTVSSDSENRLIIAADHLGGIIKTNDVVELKGDTSFRWLSRWDNVINSGGVKLYPEQIESKLASSIEASYFIYGQEDTKLGQRPVLFVESSKIDIPELEVHFMNALDKYERPYKIYTLPTFLRTANGKIKRKATADMYRTSKQS